VSNLSNKSAIVIDGGLFYSLAHRLAYDLAKVYYYSHWSKPTPFARDVTNRERLRG
jgi:hypothetical protein